tara:strand:- start:80 stop:418 length:339 start_codon:yes stop_codon:yes gene_type:complete
MGEYIRAKAVVWFEDTTQCPERSDTGVGILGLPSDLFSESIEVFESKASPERPDLLASCLVGKLSDDDIDALRSAAFKAGTVAWCRKGSSYVRQWMGGLHTWDGKTLSGGAA